MMMVILTKHEMMMLKILTKCEMMVMETAYQGSEEAELCGGEGGRWQGEGGEGAAGHLIVIMIRMVRMVRMMVMRMIKKIRWAAMTGTMRTRVPLLRSDAASCFYHCLGPELTHIINVQHS